MEGDDYIGHCVNVPARLCDLASAGEALAAPAVMDLLPSWGEIVSETHVTLRGVEKPVPASSIRMAGSGADGSRDAICGLPLTHDTAEEMPTTSRLHGAVLLGGLRRHLAPPAGTCSLTLTASRSGPAHALPGPRLLPRRRLLTSVALRPIEQGHIEPSPHRVAVSHATPVEAVG